MLDMYMTHGSIQKSLGKFPLYALVNPNRKVVVELDDSECPWPLLGECLIQDLLTKIYNGKMWVFHRVFRVSIWRRLHDFLFGSQSGHKKW